MNRHSARHIAADEIPVIEVDALRSPDRPALEAIGAQMREAAERIGFLCKRSRYRAGTDRRGRCHRAPVLRITS